MTGARALFARNSDGSVTATGLSRGPWSPDALHGGPVSALLTGVIEAHESLEPMVVSRVTVELMRPVPLTPLVVSAETVREGRKIQIVDVSIAADGVEVARARGLRQRRADVSLPTDPLHGPLVAPTPPPSPGPDELERVLANWGLEGGEAYHSHAVEHRFALGSWNEPGPVVDWTRLLVPVFEGEAVTPAQRVAASADFGNGISAVLPFERYLFINPDLTVHLLREPVGEWICLDTVSRVDRVGVGLAESALSDERGRIGRSLQSILVEERS